MRVVPANCSVIMVNTRCPLLKSLTQTHATSGSVHRSKKNRVHSRVPPNNLRLFHADTRTHHILHLRPLWLPSLLPSRTLTMSLTSDATRGRSAPFSWGDPHPATRQPHYSGSRAHTDSSSSRWHLVTSFSRRSSSSLSISPSHVPYLA